MTYIVCFLLTMIFAILSESCFKKKNKILGWFCGFIAIFIPSFIAGVRDLNVGRDIKGYVEPIVKAAINVDFESFINVLKNLSLNYDELEFGYKILIYCCTQISNSVNFSLFILQFFTFLFVYLYAYKNRENVSISFIVLAYLLLWYNYSFTFMRQSLAIAIIIYSTCFFKEKRYLKTAILFLLGVSMHISAILGILIYFLMFLYQSKKIKNKKTIMFFILIGLLIATIFFDKIIYLFTYNIKILPEKYYYYTQSYIATEDISIAEIIYRVFWIMCALIYKHKIKYLTNEENVKNDSNMILIFLLIDFATVILSSKIVNIGRIGLGFYYLALFQLLPRLHFVFKGAEFKALISFFIILLMLINWIWMFPIIKWSETYPYRSKILSIYNKE